MLKLIHFILLFYFFLWPLYAQDMPKSNPINISNVFVFTDTLQIAQNPDKVKYIDLSRKKLNHIPEIIFQCENLIYLDLKRNKIEEVSASISQLKKLKVLNLSRNRLTRLPAEIGECTNLLSLIISQNELLCLPPAIGKLTKLVSLDLWGNNFDELPIEISKISESLEYLDMRVIYMSREKQDIIEKLLPETKIYFSKGCNCH